MSSRRGKAVVARGYANEAATQKSFIFGLPFGLPNYANLLCCFKACVPQRVRYASRALNIGVIGSAQAATVRILLPQQKLRL